jgi:hypothetical protein
MDVVFQRLGFVIQKGLAAQLVARLPFFMCNYLLYIYILFILSLKKEIN